MSKSVRPLVIYHRGCWDGFCAAWVMRKVEPDAEFLPANYGEDPPSIQGIAGRRVYVVDFSYDRDTCEAIAAAASKIVILDHHRTAEKAISGLPYARFDMEKSGGRLAWEYVCDHYRVPFDAGISRENPPWLVRYTEDRDLWRWSLPRSAAVNAWLRTYPLDFGYWDEFEPFEHERDVWGRIIDEGIAILRYQETIIAAKVKQAAHVTARPPGRYSGFPTLWMVTNATNLTSEIAGKLAETSTVGCVWFEKADGIRVYSLRSSKASDVDVSRVAEFFGGGGHRHAAGFTWKHPEGKHPWEVTA